ARTPPAAGGHVVRRRSLAPARSPPPPGEAQRRAGRGAAAGVLALPAGARPRRADGGREGRRPLPLLGRPDQRGRPLRAGPGGGRLPVERHRPGAADGGAAADDGGGSGADQGHEHERERLGKGTVCERRLRGSIPHAAVPAL
ncbi:MAG: hypothetical protein AVDCRST_MAG19-1924, partial [uncultured Thermomicrobiales bacterium]